MKSRLRLVASAFLFLFAPQLAHAQARPVTLDWLDKSPPLAPQGVQFGVPWPNGAVQKTDGLNLKTANGQNIPLQSWPLAYWPDGSIKWSGAAISTVPGMIAGPYSISVGTAPFTAIPQAISITDSPDALEINTGANGVRARFPKSGSALVESLFVGNRKVAQNGRLIIQLEDRSQEKDGILKTLNFTSKISKVTLESSNPGRAVVKVEGTHAADKGDGFARTLLPFTLRFYFYAGLGNVRMVHSFIYDGDQSKDFIKSMGLTFSVPFAEEPQNRHVRFAGDPSDNSPGGAGGGLWCQPVHLLPGYRISVGPGNAYADHLAGERMPNEDQLPNRTAMDSVAVYNDMKLTQLGPDSFSIDKRTTDKSSWLHVSNGHRSMGLAVLADVSGGIALGAKDFWQKYPASLEVRNAASPVGDLTLWLWSPDAGPMDMRTYDDGPHGLTTNYEDWKPGWGTATGIAHSADLSLWAFNAIPSDADLVHMAHQVAAPPVLVASPEYYHALPVFGVWSLPDRSTPTLKWVEDQLDQLYTFYHDQQSERTWYGFWDFGDVMHNYDFGRHDWRYDVGGWAWANTELMPDMFLWYTFLRSGKPDAFRMAEAMTRHTSEVDSYHIGPFAPMGSRHNVNHWGDGAKQPRASHAMLKRYMYYLSGGDERLGDLMREQLDADLTYAKLQVYNGSHYVPTPNGPQLQGNVAAPSPAQLATMPSPLLTGGGGGGGRGRGGGVAPPQFYADGKPMEPRFSNVAFNLEWISYSINWATEWERTGDPIWRDRVLAGMKSIAARANGGPLGSNYFDIIFGGPEIMFDEKQMFDVPEFWEGFTKVMEAVSTSGGGQMTAPRGAAYAAAMRKSQDDGFLAWDKLVGTANVNAPIPQPKKITGPEVLHPVTDPAFLGSTDGWQLHGVASIQWALNALEVTELAKPYLPAWEDARMKNPQNPATTPPARGGANRGARGRGNAPAPTPPTPDPNQ